LKITKNNTTYTINLTEDLKKYAGGTVYLGLEAFNNYDPGIYLNSRESASGKPTLIIEYR
jgi:hypothetical protein